MDKVIIIAEIGECFNGDLETAKSLIIEAKGAGCDIVKFQTLDYENISDDDPEREWFKKIALNPDKIDFLIRYAGEIDINILFTPENVKTAKWLSYAGLKSIKIASSTMADKELVKFIKDCFDIIFISTGMASLDEVNEAVSALSGVRDLYLMHCISEYPTGPLLEQRGLKALDLKNVHLNMMKILMSLFPHLKIGYSDHTDGILAPIAAVAAGARVIEKHITLDRRMPIEHFERGGEYMGTDHILSLEPPELKAMVREIRAVESIMGNWKWERTEGEMVLREFLRGRFNS